MHAYRYILLYTVDVQYIHSPSLYPFPPIYQVTMINDFPRILYAYFLSDFLNRFHDKECSLISIVRSIVVVWIHVYTVYTDNKLYRIRMVCSPKTAGHQMNMFTSIPPSSLSDDVIIVC